VGPRTCVFVQLSYSAFLIALCFVETSLCAPNTSAFHSTHKRLESRQDTRNLSWSLFKCFLKQLCLKTFTGNIYLLLFEEDGPSQKPKVTNGSFLFDIYIYIYIYIYICVCVCVCVCARRPIESV